MQGASRLAAPGLGAPGLAAPGLAAPGLATLFAAFARISLTSFGGGLSGWMYRDIVVRRRWLAEGEFFDAMAICQTLPGVNIVNASIWIGYRLLGLPGAIAGFAGMVLPAAVAVVLIATAFAFVSHRPMVAIVLLGASAAAIALPLQMGLRAALAVPRRAAPLLIMAASFVAVALLHLPMIGVVLCLGTASVALSYRTLGRDRALGRDAPR